MMIIIIIIRLVQHNFMKSLTKVLLSSFVQSDMEMFDLLNVFTTSCADQTTERNAAAAVVHVVQTQWSESTVFYMHTWYLIAVLPALVYTTDN